MIKYDYKNNLADQDKLELCKHLKYRVFSRGERVYRRGDYSKSIFIILRGIAAVTYPTQTGKKKPDFLNV